MFNAINNFESKLSQFTGAPYAIMTDCCTHAIELCFIYSETKQVSFTPYTYLSVLMLMHKLGLQYNFLDEPCQEWKGEYKFHNTNIWDSARRLERGMYREGSFQCLSFGHSKPLEIGRGGAILTDNPFAYTMLKRMCYDGRDLSVSPWESQEVFQLGYHYKPTIEEANIGIRLLGEVNEQNQFIKYPDLRNVRIVT